jgi:hypothetical protein
MVYDSRFEYPVDFKRRLALEDVDVDASIQQ